MVSEKYYEVSPIEDSKITGVEDFSVQAKIDRSKLRDPSELDKLLNFFGSAYWEQPRRSSVSGLTLERVELVEGAKPLDFLRFSPSLVNARFIVSSRIMDELQTSSVPQLDRLNTKLVSNNGTVQDYCILHLASFGERKLDWEKCTFEDSFSLSTEKLKFDSIKIFNDFVDKNLVPTVKSLAYDLQAQNLPELMNVFGVIYVSNRLKKKLVNKKVTGVCFLKPITVMGQS